MPTQATAAREAAVHIVRVLREAGHVAYLAGGCVRDTLLGDEPKDYDVATDATPEQVRKLFKRSRAVGEAFGVVLVGGGTRSQPVQTEVATFRLEWGYTDNRRPDKIAFTDAQHDARRRDFTVNALFADPLHHSHPLPQSPPENQSPSSPDDGPPPTTRNTPHLGQVIDYVQGLPDLEARLIRAVGDAGERFGEDYLRMLRAARFAARLGFQIEPRTAAAIRPLAKYLGQISRERIGQEVRLMLEHPTRAAAVELVQSLRLDSAVLNEDHHDAPPAALQRLPEEAGYPVALAAWLLDRHAPADWRDAADWAAHRAARPLTRWRRALCLSNDERDAAARMLRLLGQCPAWEDLATAARKRLAADAGRHDALQLLRALDADAAAAIEQDVQPLRDDGIGLSPEPLLTGDDLIALGLKPGPRFKHLLDDTYDAQLEGRVRTHEQAVNHARRAAAGH